MKLFCLPYAGGSAQSIYSSWRDKLEPFVSLNIIELRGRGGRYSEGGYKDINEAVDDIINYMVKNDVFMWELYTEEKISFYKVKGNHFFINNKKELVINLIKDTINKIY